MYVIIYVVKNIKFNSNRANMCSEAWFHFCFFIIYTKKVNVFVIG